MKLSTLIKKREPVRVATAIPAIPATDEHGRAASNSKSSNNSSSKSFEGAKSPTAPCDCSCCHFWKDADSWRCSACAPMPAGFLGETVTLPGGKPATSTTIRADLERMHPATVAGVPLAAILDQADPADFDALRDRATLEAFTRSLLAHGEIQAKEGRP